MTILFSMTNLQLGGAQMFVLRMAAELSGKGHKVFVYDHQPEWSNSEFKESFSQNFDILCYSESKLFIFLVWKINALLKKTGLVKDFRNRVNEKRFKRAIKKHGIEIINSQMYESDKIAARVSKELNIPFVMTTHGEYELNQSEKKTININEEAKKIINAAHAVVYTAEKNIEAIKSLLPEGKIVKKIRVGFSAQTIPSFPVNIETLGIKENDFVMGMVARGIPEKGWAEAIELFRILKKNIPEKKIHLVLIGDGEELKKTVEQQHLENLHLLQFSASPLQYFSWVKYFNTGLLLTYFKGESVPNAVIEYLYCGVPVLATPMGDIPEMIMSPAGPAGELIPFNDSGKADCGIAAEKIIQWIRNPEYYTMLKKNTLAASEKFKMEKIAEEYHSLFKSVLSLKK